MWEKASRSNMKIKAFHIEYEMINWITPRAWCNDYWKSAVYEVPFDDMEILF